MIDETFSKATTVYTKDREKYERKTCDFYIKLTNAKGRTTQIAHKEVDVSEFIN